MSERRSDFALLRSVWRRGPLSGTPDCSRATGITGWCWRSGGPAVAGAAPGVQSEAASHRRAAGSRRWTSATIPKGSTVLDMGTGSGVGAVFAARWAGKVWPSTSTLRRCAALGSTRSSTGSRTGSKLLAGRPVRPVRGQKVRRDTVQPARTTRRAQGRPGQGLAVQQRD